MSDGEQAGDPGRAERIDKLLDAIDYVKSNQRDHARPLLRELIREDNDSEHAWLWMSVAVDSLDQSSICLDNVLRVNPRNAEAAGALYRIRIPEMQMRDRRARLRTVRDFALGALWAIIAFVLFTAMVSFFSLASG